MIFHVIHEKAEDGWIVAESPLFRANLLVPLKKHTALDTFMTHHQVLMRKSNWRGPAHILICDINA